MYCLKVKIEEVYELSGEPSYYKPSIIDQFSLNEECRLGVTLFLHAVLLKCKTTKNDCKSKSANKAYIAKEKRVASK
jgi:hypothetical protein